MIALGVAGRLDKAASVRVRTELTRLLKSAFDSNPRRLAEALQTKESHLSRILRAQRSPTLALAAEVARVSGKPLAEFVGDTLARAHAAAVQTEKEDIERRRAAKAARAQAAVPPAPVRHVEVGANGLRVGSRADPQPTPLPEPALPAPDKPHSNGKHAPASSVLQALEAENRRLRDFIIERLVMHR